MVAESASPSCCSIGIACPGVALGVALSGALQDLGCLGFGNGENSGAWGAGLFGVVVQPEVIEFGSNMAGGALVHAHGLWEVDAGV